ncbi:transketolase [Cerasicoccus arenae]|uniref:Transketolase n=1 Tax=Cerasicoccus arenae TaxID=424488 RepID=A0A8J3DAN8_9BACT|nr:transketolase [Cerasicoccus arenae]MBK1858856.1 transketolase [Cerasicoccus arenae]GHB96076.1 transketolase [Cerasicoccus arenae]
MSLNTEALSRAATEARGLSMDAVTAANSGHLGLPLGATELGAVLFGHALQCNPKEPKWINRDRFILSAGHGSMFLYSWLCLSQYNVSAKDVANFRQLHSITPGHPEFGDTDGVECTTGPLGQGVGNSVGYAVSGKMLAAEFNTDTHKIFDNHIVCLAGDGCLQEGVSCEASAYAGRFGLDNLILFYDSNDVTLDAMANKTQCEDTAMRYEAYGWDVVTLSNGNDIEAIATAYEQAKANDNGKPKLIILKTEIGRGIPEVAGTQKAHGEAGVKFVDAARKALGLPEEKFFISEDTKAYFTKLTQEREIAYAEWSGLYDAWRSANPDKAALLDTGVNHTHATATELLAKIPAAEAGKANATRNSGGDALNAICAHAPLVLSGSADLHGSTKNYIKDGGDFDTDHFTGRNFHFGIREHGMGAIMNGIAYDGIYKVSGATFFTFSDYMRPSVRLAALAKLPVFYIWTHDSVGVGEDGPTHQPIEHVASLRAMPNLDVMRPADAEETAAAFAHAIERSSGPVALVLSRQNLPDMSEISVEDRRQGTLKGGYIAKKETGPLETILIATGSEVQHCMEAAKSLGDGVRVVSMPCCELFDAQSCDYKESILPAACTKRIAMEAGVTLTWWKYVGTEGKVLGIDRFGISAPGNTVMKELGMTAEAVIAAVKG